MNGESGTERLTQTQMWELADRLSVRDAQILQFLSRHRYATTGHLRRIFFVGHATPSAATRAAIRVLDRLMQQRLVTRLERKVGGHTRGSAAYIWHLDAVGERLTRKDGKPRRRFVDPGLPFLDHSLQVTDTAVNLHDLAATENLTLTALDAEPDAWRVFHAASGSLRILKPDLYAHLSTPEFDDHWYLEIDRGTESLPVLIQKCRQYTAYRATGRAQLEHGVFPRVLWIVPTARRVERLTAAIHTDPTLPTRLFTVITPEQLTSTIHAPPDP